MADTEMMLLIYRFNGSQFFQERDIDGCVRTGMASEIELFLLRCRIEIFQRFCFCADRWQMLSFPFVLIDDKAGLCHPSRYAPVLKKYQVVADLHRIFMAGIVNTASKLWSHCFPLNPVSMWIDNGEKQG